MRGTWGTVVAMAVAGTMLAPATAGAQLLGLGGLFGPKPAPAPAPEAAPAPGPFYVDRDGLGGPCDDARTPAQVTAEKPWCSLTRAVAVAPAGTTVHVRASTTPLAFVVSTRTTGLHVIGEPGAQVYGLRIRGAGWTIERIKTSTGIELTAGRDFVLRDAEVEGSGVHLADVTNATITHTAFRDLTFPSNIRWNKTRNQGYGVRAVEVTGLEVTDNTFDRVQIDAVQLNATSSALIARNRVAEVRETRGSHAEAFQVEGASDQVLIEDNTVLDSNRGVQIGAAVQRVVLRRNLFAHLLWFGVNTHGADTKVLESSFWDTSQSVGGNQQAVIVQADADRVTIADTAQRYLILPARTGMTEHHNFIAQAKWGATYASTDVVGGPTNDTLMDPRDPTTFAPLPDSPLLGASSTGQAIGAVQP